MGLWCRHKILPFTFKAVFPEKCAPTEGSGSGWMASLAQLSPWRFWASAETPKLWYTSQQDLFTLCAPSCATVLEQESEAFTFPSPALGDSQKLHWVLVCSIDYLGVRILFSFLRGTHQGSTGRETDLTLALFHLSIQSILDLDKNVVFFHLFSCSWQECHKYKLLTLTSLLYTHMWGRIYHEFTICL
jgi:hypothetical protein